MEEGGLFFARAWDWEKNLVCVGSEVRNEERMAAGSLYIAERRDIPLVPLLAMMVRMKISVCRI